jgi:hypothetical protein
MSTPKPLLTITPYRQINHKDDLMTAITKPTPEELRIYDEFLNGANQLLPQTMVLIAERLPGEQPCLHLVVQLPAHSNSTGNAAQKLHELSNELSTDNQRLLLTITAMQGEPIDLPTGKDSIWLPEPDLSADTSIRILTQEVLATMDTESDDWMCATPQREAQSRLHN